MWFRPAAVVLVGLCASAEAAAAEGSSHVKEIFSFSMWPLWGAAVVLVIFIVGRIKALKAAAVLDADAAQAVGERLRALDVSGAVEAAAGDSIQATTWAKGLRDYTLGGVTLNEALTNASMNGFRTLYKNIQGIGTVASIAPLLGLLGTIIGMIMVFNDLSRSASPDKSQLAEGIMVALFTTAAGLIVAIPGIVCGRWLNARITAFAQQVEDDIDSVCYDYHLALREAGANGDDFTVDVLNTISIPAAPAPASAAPAPAAARRSRPAPGPA